ncbi:MAG: hypothetical protein RL095_647 [Verrucomicrobiota bacterium]|jgi:hypothetical protein
MSVKLIVFICSLLAILVLGGTIAWHQNTAERLSWPGYEAESWSVKNIKRSSHRKKSKPKIALTATWHVDKIRYSETSEHRAPLNPKPGARIWIHPDPKNAYSYWVSFDPPQGGLPWAVAVFLWLLTLIGGVSAYSRHSAAETLDAARRARLKREALEGATKKGIRLRNKS